MSPPPPAEQFSSRKAVVPDPGCRVRAAAAGPRHETGLGLLVWVRSRFVLPGLPDGTPRRTVGAAEAVVASPVPRVAWDAVQPLRTAPRVRAERGGGGGCSVASVALSTGRVRTERISEKPVELGALFLHRISLNPVYKLARMPCPPLRTVARAYALPPSSDCRSRVCLAPLFGLSLGVRSVRNHVRDLGEEEEGGGAQTGSPSAAQKAKEQQRNTFTPEQPQQTPVTGQFVDLETCAKVPGAPCTTQLRVGQPNSHNGMQGATCYPPGAADQKQ